MARPRTPDLSPRAREIVGAARELLEREGREALTMRRLAGWLGVRAPSIYKHVADKDALEAAVVSLGLRESTAVIAAAMDDAPDPLGALTGAYRGYALEHPHLYRLMTEEPLRRGLLRPGSEQAGIDLFLLVAGGNRDLARAIWAFTHGMTILEVTDRFPPGAELEAAWRCGVDAFRDLTMRSSPNQES